MRAPLEPSTELAAMADNSVAPFERAFRALARLRARQFDGELVSPAEVETAIGRIATLSADTMTLADLLGRRRLALEVRYARERGAVLDPGLILFASTPIVPHVPFEEVAEDIIRRTPELVDPANPAPFYRQVQEMYRNRHAFALAHSADIRLTTRIRDELRKAQTRGIARPKTEALIKELGDFTAHYAETVYRTNLNTAYTAGRFAQARDPDVAEAIGAFEFVAVRDADTRPNHLAADGLIASQFDPIWQQYRPPLGYNCRCSLRMVDVEELREKGLVSGGMVKLHVPPTFSAAHPDPGFGAPLRL